MTIEEHPLEPFLPENGRILFLGSFPPPKVRWSMEFFYPNWINDFWRIQGLIHFGDKGYFEADPPLPALKGRETEEKDSKSNKSKCYNKEKIVEFCQEEGLAFFDTARKVCRLKDNADDNFLEIVEGTDVFALLTQMPQCHTIVTTGGKASEELQTYFEKHGLTIPIPKVGECVEVYPTLTWYRMPSTSRAYPMKLEKKAEYYRKLFTHK